MTNTRRFEQGNIPYKSWSPAFYDHVRRKAYAERYACVRCGKGPTTSTWLGEYTHIGCLSAVERSMIPPHQRGR